jgi:hypothetical protein
MHEETCTRVAPVASVNGLTNRRISGPMAAGLVVVHFGPVEKVAVRTR